MPLASSQEHILPCFSDQTLIPLGPLPLFPQIEHCSPLISLGSLQLFSMFFLGKYCFYADPTEKMQNHWSIGLYWAAYCWLMGRNAQLNSGFCLDPTYLCILLNSPFLPASFPLSLEEMLSEQEAFRAFWRWVRATALCLRCKAPSREFSFAEKLNKNNSYAVHDGCLCIHLSINQGVYYVPHSLSTHKPGWIVECGSYENIKCTEVVIVPIYVLSNWVCSKWLLWKWNRDCCLLSSWTYSRLIFVSFPCR